MPLNRSPVPQTGISEVWISARPCLSSLLGVDCHPALNGRSMLQTSLELNKAPTLDGVSPSVPIAALRIERNFPLCDVAFGVWIMKHVAEELQPVRNLQFDVSD